MGVYEAVLLFGIIAVLAAMPSTSVALVVTRAATVGVGNGLAVVAGIVLGDLVFVVLALLGLSVVAETMGSLFMIIRYVCAFYLLWLGFSLLRGKRIIAIDAVGAREKGSVIASLLAGFFLTLGDIKAVFFYVSLLPVFIEVSALQMTDMMIVMLITVVGVGGVKTIYALSATRIAALARDLKFENAMRKTAAGFMVGAGSYLIVKA